MIKAAGRTGDGRPLALLGLTGENVTRLVADEPLVVELAQLGLPDVQVVVVYGKTEDDIIDKLSDNKLQALLDNPGDTA